MSVSISQAATPGRVAPCPLCEINIEALWCWIIVELPTVTSRVTESTNNIPDTRFPSLVASGGELSRRSRVRRHHAYRVPATRAPNSPFL